MERSVANLGPFKVSWLELHHYQSKFRVETRHCLTQQVGWLP